MKKSVINAGLLAGFFWMSIRDAQAVCLGLTLQGVPATVTFQGGVGEYSVFDPAEYMQTVGFTVGGGAAVGTCNYFVTLSTGGGTFAQRKMTRGATQLNYNVYTSAAKTNILKDVPLGSASDAIVGTFPTGLGQTASQNLYWTITPAQVVTASATRFQDSSLTLSLYEGLALGVYILASTKNITFQGRAESSIDISLVDSGGSFNTSDTTQTVSFGTLSSGQIQSYDTLIRSNDGYRVTVQSQNQQVLKHAAAPAVSSTVPYIFSFGGAAVDLTSGAPVQAAASAGTATSATGDRFQTRFTVGTMTGAETAGNYQDVLTVTVAAY